MTKKNSSPKKAAAKTLLKIKSPKSKKNKTSKKTKKHIRYSKNWMSAQDTGYGKIILGVKKAISEGFKQFMISKEMAKKDGRSFKLCDTDGDYLPIGIYPYSSTGIDYLKITMSQIMDNIPDNLISELDGITNLTMKEIRVRIRPKKNSIQTNICPEINFNFITKGIVKTAYLWEVYSRVE